MLKKRGKFTTFFYLTIVYALFNAVILFMIIGRINASIIMAGPEPDVANNTGPVLEEPVSVEPVSPSGVLQTLTGVPSGADSLSFSSDGSYCVYCYEGVLYIMDIQSNKIVKKIAHKDKISNAMLMYDRNTVIYFTSRDDIVKSKASSMDKITIYNYNIDNGKESVQYSFNTLKGSVIRQADYSSFTSHICFNVESGEADNIYYVTLYKKLARAYKGKPIDNMALVNSRQAVYYTRGNILYYQLNPVKSLDKIKTRLLGCDINDMAYVQSLLDKSCIYVIKGTAVVKKIKLADVNYISTYSNKNNIYLVYPDHLLDLSAEPAKSILYDKNCRFDGFIENRLYLSDSNGNIEIRNPVFQ